MAKAQVVLFKNSGKYYTQEEWEIPKGAITPADMAWSKDFRLISGDGIVLIPDQEPWGYPHIIPFAVSYDVYPKPNYLD